MNVHQIDEVAGTIFPAGRHTRVIVGPGGLSTPEDSSWDM